MKIKKQTKHLDFYNKCMSAGLLPETTTSGLCGCGTDKYIDGVVLNLFEPTREERKELIDEGWWASGLPAEDGEKYSSFTPLRQTIVLFMAAINNEL